MRTQASPDLCLGFKSLIAFNFNLHSLQIISALPTHLLHKASVSLIEASTLPEDALLRLICIRITVRVAVIVRVAVVVRIRVRVCVPVHVAISPVTIPISLTSSV